MNNKSMDRSVRSLLVFWIWSRSLCSSLLLLGISLSAQETVTRTVHINDSLSGTCTSAVLVIDGDTLRHGVYRFNSTVQDTTSDNVFRVIDFQGEYNRGQKDGEWYFRQAYVTRKGPTVVDGYRAKQPISGMEFLIEGEFELGVPVGTWESVRREIKSGEPADTVKYIRSEFREGALYDAVYGRDRGIEFSDSFSEGGFLDGKWEFTSLETQEVNGKIICVTEKVLLSGLMENATKVIMFKGVEREMVFTIGRVENATKVSGKMTAEKGKGYFTIWTAIFASKVGGQMINPYQTQAQ